MGATDHGDLPVVDPAGAVGEVVAAVHEALLDSLAVVLLGGDNSITRPGVLGLPESLIEPGERYGQLDAVGLLTLDAHHDLRDTTGGLNNGNPVRALLEDGLPGRNVWQVGIQPYANSPAYAAVAREEGITVITAEEVRRNGLEHVVRNALEDLTARVDTIYVDLDLDVLDRAFAPACPGSRPGGLAPWELLKAARLCGADQKVSVIDIVEVDPERDVAEATVLTAASCLLAFAAGVASRWGPEGPPMEKNVPGGET